MADRALWITPVADVGGVARHVLDAARAGIPGYELVVVCPEGPLVADLEALGVPHITAEIGPKFGMAHSIEVMRSIWRRLDPAVVHSHLSFADLAAAAALPPGFRGRTALASTEHGIATGSFRYQSGWKVPAMAGVHTARLRTIDASIAVCEATATAMRDQWRARRVTVIRNGVDRRGLDTLVPRYSTSQQGVDPEGLDTLVPRYSTSQQGVDPEGLDTLVRSRPTDPILAGRVGARNERRVETSPSSALHIGTLARLSSEKRLDALITAFARVAAHHDAHLTLGGDGPERARLEALVRDLGLTDRVSLPGFVDAAGLLAQLDVFALTSATENCSYALLDAVAAGLGVCASPVGGNPEIVPAHCLADPADPAPVAAVLVEQALEPTRRPRLPADWPTVAEMTAQIAEVYASCR